ncbi:MAG: endonuclease III [Armatimonadetes bacterium]|nr:endonuclease III [Armatimonadota bacterium]
MPRESKKRAKERAIEIMRRLQQAHPRATTELRWKTPFQLLVATILSAQCTDERVNRVTAELFKRYRSPKDFASADPAVLEEEIKPTGFYRNKARAVIGAAKMIVEEFGGQVPRTMEEMLRLPGVQRKTANVVLGTAYGLPTGIVVDTHVDRVSKRLGLVPADTKQAEKIERQLMDLFPQDQWITTGHAMVLHGRYVCTARNPKCAECILEDVCPKIGVGPARPGDARRQRKTTTS